MPFLDAASLAHPPSIAYFPPPSGRYCLNATSASIPDSLARPAAIRRHAIWLVWLLPVVCHLAFSWIGFNPTDEGWLQAIARRVLEGQVPHRDFISVRPVLSALLQVPLVWLGGDHLFWWARLWGWLEIGAVAWLWSGLLLPDRTKPWPRATAFGVILALNAHVFPVMAWHTLDGILLCSAAIALARRGTVPAWRGAFILAGLACLTRQNFVFCLPFLVLGLPSWRFWPVLLWSAAAPLLYLLWLAPLGALRDFFQQILATGGSLGHVLQIPLYYPEPYVGLGLGMIVVAVALAAARRLTRWGAWFESGVILLTGGYAVWCLWFSKILAGSLLLFGLALVLAVTALVRGRLDATARLLVFSSLGLAWTVSISNGYASPALMGGVVLVVLWWLIGRLDGHAPLSSDHTQLSGTFVFVALLLALSHARTTFPYEDRPAGELTRDAGDVMRGASGLRTNETTYSALLELQTATRQLDQQHRPYVIFTDYSAFWAQSPRVNPVACEWPQIVELAFNQPALVERLKNNLQQLPADTVFLFHRHVTALLPEGHILIAPVGDGFYGIQLQLIPQLQLLNEGRYFASYTLKRAGP